MAYLIFTDIKEAETYQDKVDQELGYPESLDSLRWVGGGIHAPKELGQALHYDYVSKSSKVEQWALSKQGTVAKPITATEVAKLPDGWVTVEAMQAEDIMREK